MKKLINNKENKIIELSVNEMTSINGGIEKWMVVGAFMVGFVPGCFALGYYNASH
jgi:lactobin A/cerein 7B family class IIb bacteriocin